MGILGLKKCPECGALYGADDKVCTKCGRDLISMTFKQWWTTFKDRRRVRKSQGPDYAKASLKYASIGFIIFLFYAIPLILLLLGSILGNCQSTNIYGIASRCENPLIDGIVSLVAIILFFAMALRYVIMPLMIILFILGIVFAWKSLQITKWKDNKLVRKSITLTLIPLLTVLILFLVKNLK